jgi:hypothetical protein
MVSDIPFLALAHQTCKTCRYWTEDGDDDHRGFYSADAKPEGWKACLLASRGAEGLAIAAADDDYGIVLWTAPEFACCQWQAVDVVIV